jgi:hypothetical protein
MLTESSKNSFALPTVLKDSDKYYIGMVDVGR